MRKEQQFDKNQHINHFKNGIKLSHLINNNQTSFLSVKDFLELPFSTYFLNLNNETEIINHEGAQVCGFKSIDEAKGKSLLDISPIESTRTLINNCNEVHISQQTKIFEETHLRSDNTSMQFLSVKVPWYDDNDNIIGIMGASIALGKHSLANALSQLTTLGLLNKEKQNAPPKQYLTLNNISLSNRESQCLELTVKGMTAKMIAKKLAISHRTVEEYIANLRLKVGAGSKAELIQLTIDNFTCVF